jgi:predicted enzyme related to lactoylglutathione lyase
MSVVEKHAPGSFCWVELGTTNAKAAKTFYTNLFGWQPNDMPLGPDQFYTMLQMGGKEIGALYELDESMRRMGIAPHWMHYITVDSADQSAADVKALGGKVMKEPFDVFDAGRMAVIEDPTRAAFALWQPNRHIGTRIVGEPGTLCWCELITGDKPKALEFYTKLFKWTTKTNPSDPQQYTEISNQGRPIGGAMQMSKDWGDAPAHWMAYFLVANCDTSAARIQELGGAVKMPAMDIPKVGRFAVVTDPQEAVFAIFQPVQ